ncbi:metabotropic glutamate receptor 3 isoform X2 [Procambarus clarkii]|uniref:metabotropic glutamate receptor 3 isoform X2 n=1 Tax=Procambarus clarkii TaxID=6728 RepID=UPI003744B176
MGPTAVMQQVAVLVMVVVVVGVTAGQGDEGALTSPNTTLGTTLVYPQDATVLLGALFPIHTSRKDPITGIVACDHLQGDYGIQPLEALLFTLDEINTNPNLLPGITLGTLVMDSCDHPTPALTQTLGFIKGYLAGQNEHHQAEFTCGDGSAPTFRSGLFDKVVGVIGGRDSAVSVQMASVLRVIEMPQISYISTSASLNDRERFPFFLRTVPSDSTQVQAILDILRSFKWSYASMVYSSGEYGEGGYRELTRTAAEYDVCFASPAHVLSKNDPDDVYQDVVKQLVNREANVVVVFAQREVAIRLLKTVRLLGAHSRFLWIGSDGWSSTPLQEVEAVAEGSIAVQPLARSLPGFEEYFRALTPENNGRNPWFQEYWNSDLSVSGTHQHEIVQWLHFVRDSAHAFAHALHAMWEEHCEGVAGICDAMAHSGHIHGQDLFQQLLRVSFLDTTNSTFRFESSGAGPARYTILNYQRHEHFSYRWVPVGTYTNTSGEVPELNLPSSSVQYRLSTAPPTSSCGKPCTDDQAKILLQEACCWRCEDCQPHQYLNRSTHLCHDCGDCQRPDRDACVDKDEKFIDYKNRWAITSLAFASLGIFSTVLMGVIFWVHLDTPVIKAASRELSYILLGGIFLSFVMSFVIVAPPSYVTCGLTRFFLGFSYTVCYAAILTKTNRISRIFNKSPTKSHKAIYTSPRSQVVIVTMLVSVEVAINVAWMVYNTPNTEHLCARTSQYRVRICGGLDDYSYVVGLVYPLILVLFCTIYAIKTRKCPGGFNEARYIAFTNYTTCLIWLVFVPLYLSTGATDDIRIVTLALSLSLGGFVQLGCLFFPKVYIVLFKPEKNTRDAVMSISRTSYNNNNNNRDSSYRASGRFPDDAASTPPHPIFFVNGGKPQEEALQKARASQHLDQDAPGRVNHLYIAAHSNPATGTTHPTTTTTHLPTTTTTHVPTTTTAQLLTRPTHYPTKVAHHTAL